jgi:hypothetical protein
MQPAGTDVLHAVVRHERDPGYLGDTVRGKRELGAF